MHDEKEPMQSRWLICGDGFLGSEFCQGFDSLSIPSGIHAILKRAHQATSDQLLDAAEWLTQSDLEFFVNAAGPSIVSDSASRVMYYENEPLNLVKAHIQLLSKLQNPPTYIFLSSAAVYGETTEMGASEATPTKPISAYGVGKVKAEEYLLNLTGVNVKVIILRLFSTYSSNLMTRLPFAIKQKFDMNSHVIFEGTGREIRDFIHTEDLIASTRLIASQVTNEMISVWNVASGTGITVNEIVKIAAMEYESMYNNLKYSFSFNYTSREFDPMVLLANISKLSQIGFIPKVNPYAGLAAYFRLGK